MIPFKCFLNFCNSLRRKEASFFDNKSKIFYYSYTNGDSYHFIDAYDDILKVSEKMYRKVYVEMKEFQKVIFNIDYELPFVEEEGDEFKLF